MVVVVNDPLVFPVQLTDGNLGVISCVQLACGEASRTIPAEDPTQVQPHDLALRQFTEPGVRKSSGALPHHGAGFGEHQLKRGIRTMPLLADDSPRRRRQEHLARAWHPPN